MKKTDSASGRAGSVRYSGTIERQIRLTRLALLWEQVWKALWPASGFVGLFIGLSLLGAWAFLPGSIHAAALAATIAATAVSLWFGFRSFSVANRDQAIRRLETANRIDHRILSSLHDKLAPVSINEDTDVLWREHKRRLAQQVNNVKAPMPRSHLPRRDPNAFRFAVVLLLFIAGVIAQGDWEHRLQLALSPNTKDTIGQVTRIDAWITPPTYTDTPPLFLTEDGAVSETVQNETILVPEGSHLSVKVSGSTQQPTLSLSESADSDAGFVAQSDSVFEAKLTVTETTKVNVRQGLFSLAVWDISVSPDTVPVVALTGKVEPDHRQAVNVPYKAADDYGISELSLFLTLKDKDAGVAKYYGSEHSVELTPLSLDSTSIKETAKENLTEHPWSGLPVELSVRAKDERGQQGESIPVQITLPERHFTKPLAAAVIEQRKNLAHGLMTAKKVAKYLDALTTAPDDTYFEDITVYLGIRAAYWRLSRVAEFTKFRALAARQMPGSQSQEAVDDFDEKIETLTKSTIKLLWDVALKIEDGDKSLAERELLAAQEALMEALENGASDEEIAALVENLKQALDRYLEALARQALEEFRRTGRAPPPADPNAPVIEMEDLDDLLESIEELAETGARDSARQLLSQLQGLLQNLQPGDFAPSLTPSQQAMQNALGQLGDMIGDLRGVMDETFQQNQNGTAPQNGEEGGPRQALQGLANRQRGIGDTLEGLLGELGENGTDIPSALGQAERSIERGANALDSGETGRALDQQGRAIDQLRQGAQELAQQLLDQLQGSGTGIGQGGQRGRDTDPLGRPNAGAGPDFGDSVKVPSERSLQRARDILKEIQRRAADKSRPMPELEYLERLLKRF